MASGNPIVVNFDGEGRAYFAEASAITLSSIEVTSLTIGGDAILPGQGASAVSGLGDVSSNIAPEPGQVLTWSSTLWIPSSVPNTGGGVSEDLLSSTSGTLSGMISGTSSTVTSLISSTSSVVTSIISSTSSTVTALVSSTSAILTGTIGNYLPLGGGTLTGTVSVTAADINVTGNVNVLGDGDFTGNVTATIFRGGLDAAGGQVTNLISPEGTSDAVPLSYLPTWLAGETLNSLGQVSISFPSDGDALVWDNDNTQWIASTLVLTSLDNVSAVVPADRQALIFDNSLTSWVPSTLPESGGGGGNSFEVVYRDYTNVTAAGDTTGYIDMLNYTIPSGTWGVSSLLKAEVAGYYQVTGSIRNSTLRVRINGVDAYLDAWSNSAGAAQIPIFVNLRMFNTGSLTEQKIYMTFHRGRSALTAGTGDGDLNSTPDRGGGSAMRSLIQTVDTATENLQVQIQYRHANTAVSTDPIFIREYALAEELI